MSTPTLVEIVRFFDYIDEWSISKRCDIIMGHFGIDEGGAAILAAQSIIVEANEWMNESQFWEAVELARNLTPDADS
jgi:hypothetical protein